MFNDRRSLFKFFSLTLLLGLSAGFLFNYYGGNTKDGFVSPVVFGKEVGQKAKNSSPFSALFDKLVPQPSQTSLSPASTLSYKGTGVVLGEKTASDSVLDSGSPSQSSNNSSSGSSNSNNTASTTSTTTTSSSSSTSTSQSTTDSSTTVLTSTQQAVEDVTNVIIGYLVSRNYAALYNSMSANFKYQYTSEEFISDLSTSETIKNGIVTAPANIFGANSEFAEQPVRLNLPDGSIQSYTNLYHLEGSAWTLMGTNDL